ncbi:MAG: cyclic nucleotide-binding domain-containing protein [Alphaproteobacteria bacterium]
MLTSDERQLLTSIMQSVTLPPHRLVFVETEPAQCVFNLTEGVVKTYKMLTDGRRQVTGFVFPGDFLGLVQRVRHAYTAETVTEATLCQFPRKKLEALFESLPTLELRLLGNASHELAAAQDQMILLGRKSARERVASFLLVLASVAQRRGQSGNPISIPMARADVADYLGLTGETVSRTITKFSMQGLINVINDKRMEIVDPVTIHRIAHGAWTRVDIDK